MLALPWGLHAQQRAAQTTSAPVCVITALATPGPTRPGRIVPRPHARVRPCRGAPPPARRSLRLRRHGAGRTLLREHRRRPVSMSSRLARRCAPDSAHHRWVPSFGGRSPRRADRPVCQPARPGGIVAGVSNFGEELAATRVQLLRRVAQADRLGRLTTPPTRCSGGGTRNPAEIRAQGLTAMRLGLSSPRRAMQRTLRDPTGAASRRS